MDKSFVDFNWELSPDDTNVIKGLAILSMLWSHLFMWPPTGYGPFGGVTRTIALVCGHTIVALFLFCSGYGLSANFSKQKQTWRYSVAFVLKRLVKFYFNFWVVFVLFMPIGIFVFHKSPESVYGEGNALSGLLKEFFCIDGISYNGAWWFNKLIVILYVLFPLLYWMMKRVGWLLIIISLLVLRYLGAKHLPGDVMGIFSWQVPFLIGMFWWNWKNALPKVSEFLFSNRVLFAIVSIVLFAAISVIGVKELIPHIYGLKNDGLFVLAVVLLVISLFRYSGPLNKSLQLIGLYSANIYLVQEFVYGQWFPSYVYSLDKISVVVSWFVVLLVTLLISIGLEKLKTLFHYNEKVNKLCSFLEKKVVES